MPDSLPTSKLVSLSWGTKTLSTRVTRRLGKIAQFLNKLPKYLHQRIRYLQIPNFKSCFETSYSGENKIKSLSYFILFLKITTSLKNCPISKKICHPGVNFTNILWAAFAPKSFHQKIRNPNCKHIKAALRTVVWKSCS